MAIDHIEAERFSALGDSPLVWIDMADADAAARAVMLARGSMAIVGGLDRAGTLPMIDAAAFDLMLTAHPRPPSPWVAAADVDAAARSIGARVTNAPIAAGVAARTLRITAGLDFADAVAVESLAYGTLLGGAEFRRWLEGRPATTPVPAGTRSFVRMARDGDHVTILLARPDTRNGMCAGMRDALHEALCAVLDDPTEPTLTLTGEGACFSTGGVLGEFGTATDLAQAHMVRTLRCCALRLHELGARAQVRLHGACIGSGIEIAAGAADRVALPGAFFQLPELAMGLMPGAGGTVSVARAIGRHRACCMMLSGRRIARDTAADWGLVRAAAA